MSFRSRAGPQSLFLAPVSLLSWEEMLKLSFDQRPKFFVVNRQVRLLARRDLQPLNSDHSFVMLLCREIREKG